MNDSFYFDGQKAISIDQFPEEAWRHLTGGATGSDGEIKERYIRVPFLNRAVNIRANALSTLPFAIVNNRGVDIDSSDDYQNEVEFLPNPQRLLWLVEACLFLTSRAYLFRQFNLAKEMGIDDLAKTFDLRYMIPTSIKEVYDDSEDGTGDLIGFRRMLKNGEKFLFVEDVIHFWQLDPYVEIGPGNNSPAMAALSAAGVLFNLAEFAAAYFERGAIKPTILSLGGKGGQAAKGERDRFEAWWRRVGTGIKNAFTSKVVAGEVTATVLGEGLGELSDSQLTKEQRIDISVASGIPITKLWSTEATGLGGGGVVQADERSFYEETVVPQSLFIQSILNEQLFQPMGLRWRFRPETLDVFQTDEQERSQSLKNYVEAGYRLSTASEILGVELPPDMDYDDLDTMKEEDKEAAAERMPDFGGSQNPQPNPQNPQQQAARAWYGDTLRPAQSLLKKYSVEMFRDEIARWERKALAKGADCSFESDVIPSDIMTWIKTALEQATTPEEVKAAFSGPFRETSERWRWDYP